MARTQCGLWRCAIWWRRRACFRGCSLAAHGRRSPSWWYWPASALQMAAPYLFMMRGLQSVSPQEAVGIGLLEPVLLPLWVLLVWGEVPAWWTVAGAALILAGLLLRYFVLSRLAKRSPLP